MRPDLESSIREALRTAQDEQKATPTRQGAIVITKLEEALLWATYKV